MTDRDIKQHLPEGPGKKISAVIAKNQHEIELIKYSLGIQNFSNQSKNKKIRMDKA